MTFSEKLTALRRQNGISQEQLADRLGITRQSVSKWESGAVMPEIEKLVILSDLFQVSVDYLIKDQLETPEPSATEPALQPLEAKIDTLSRQAQENFGSVFCYTSTKRLFGLPLLSIRFGHARHPNRENTAVGIVAIGNFSLGVVSVGLISAGILSLGLIAFGIVALGCVSLGAALAVGVTALGATAIGVTAFGSTTIGVSTLGNAGTLGIPADFLP